MSGYKLQTLLEVREQAVIDAEQALVTAVAWRVEQERHQSRLQHQVHSNEAALLPLLTPGALGRTAGAMQTRDRFVARVRAELLVDEAALETLSKGPLAQALRQEQQARVELIRVKQEFRLINRHRDNAEDVERKQAERRADVANDDWALGRRR